MYIVFQKATFVGRGKSAAFQMMVPQELQGHRYSSVCTEVLDDPGTDEVTSVYIPASILHARLDLLPGAKCCCVSQFP